MMFKKWPRTKRTMRLRTHALFVSTCLIFLIGLLGSRAYLVARSHLAEMSDLAGPDMKAQAILVKMEGVSASRFQALRKFQITSDPAYQRLAVSAHIGLQRMIAQFKELLHSSHPEISIQPSDFENAKAIQTLRKRLDQERRNKLMRADAAARGLLRLILVALFLTVGIASWLLYLFYRGLLRPIQSIKEATSRISSGELSHRIPEQCGVAELRNVSRSFNSMAERLEELERAKADFLALVSHEFKNPLAALKEGLSLVISRGSDLPQHSRDKTLAACLIASKRIESMINNLLVHSQLEKGMFEFSLAVRELSPAIRLAIEEVEPLAAKKGMCIQYEEAANIQASLNSDAMIQALENLLLNAIKYGQDKTAIEVRANMREKAVEISVTNTGKAMPSVELKRIFERFYRGSNASLQKGLGLGLHVVKRIVEAHHGTISVLSDSGTTRFTILLPDQSQAVAAGGAP